MLLGTLVVGRPGKKLHPSLLSWAPFSFLLLARPLVGLAMCVLVPVEFALESMPITHIGPSKWMLSAKADVISLNYGSERRTTAQPFGGNRDMSFN